MKEYTIRQYPLGFGLCEDLYSQEQINIMIKDGWDLVSNNVISERHQDLQWNTYSSDNRITDANSITNINNHYIVCIFVRNEVSKTLYGSAIGPGGAG